MLPNGKQPFVFYVRKEVSMNQRAHNFAAGPSALPLEVLQRAQADLLNYKGYGCSVMEMSHRSPIYNEIITKAQNDLRALMNIPEDYEVLFLQGGASTQFASVPMNLANKGDITSYAITGNFANKAYQEALKWTDARIVASAKDANFTYIPEINVKDIDPRSKYLHITGNNTIYGVCYYDLPQIGDIPLVADWSSSILSMDIDVKKHALIYAGAQKNIAPAGVTLVIVKKDCLVEKVEDYVPTMLQYQSMIKNGSMYNTPPCYSIYMAGLMFEYLLEQGGVKEMERRCKIKSDMIYDLIDSSSIYTNKVDKKNRSLTNAVFTLPDEDLTKRFIEFCGENEILNIKGHKLVGGCRASLYNGVTIEDAEYLAEVMRKFEKKL